MFSEKAFEFYANWLMTQISASSFIKENSWKKYEITGILFLVARQKSAKIGWKIIKKLFLSINLRLNIYGVR